MSWFDLAMFGLCGLLTLVCWLIGRAHARMIIKATRPTEK